MSRTYRKKYVPIRSKETMEQIEEAKAYAAYYAANGTDANGWRWFSPNYRVKSGLMYTRFDKNVIRDGNKAHGDLSAMLSIAVKKIDSKLRVRMSQELKRMKAGVIGWDENIENANKIRAHERSLCWYSID